MNPGNNCFICGKPYLGEKYYGDAYNLHRKNMSLTCNNSDHWVSFVGPVVLFRQSFRANALGFHFDRYAHVYISYEDGCTSVSINGIGLNKTLPYMQHTDFDTSSKEALNSQIEKLLLL